MKILVVAAHPDDEVLGCGGTMARLAAEGHEIHIAVLGGGITSRYDKREEADAGLLADEGRLAGADDLVIAVRATGEEAGRNALEYAESLLERPSAAADGDRTWRPKTLAGAAEARLGSTLQPVRTSSELGLRWAVKSCPLDSSP